MKAKRYEVQAQARRSTVWEPIYYTDDPNTAERYAASMATSAKIQATKVIDNEQRHDGDTGKVGQPGTVTTDLLE